MKKHRYFIAGCFIPVLFFLYRMIDQPQRRLNATQQAVVQNLPLSVEFRVLSADTGEITLNLKNKQSCIVRVVVKSPYTSEGYHLSPITDSLAGLVYDVWVADTVCKILKVQVQQDLAMYDSLNNVLRMQSSSPGNVYEISAPMEIRQRDSVVHRLEQKEAFQKLFDEILSCKKNDLELGHY